MGMLQRENKQQEQSPRQVLGSKFAGARHNLLLIVIFTAINIVLLVTNSNSYFLFSAYIPYLLVDFGMLLCGMYPGEIYVDEFAGMVFLDRSFFVILLIIAIVILALYLLCWFLSKQNKVGYLIFALVFFSIDTVLMLLLNGVATEMIIDIVFHGWVIYSLVNGIIAHRKLRQLPEELEEAAAVEALEER